MEEEIENKTADIKKYRREYYQKNKKKRDKYFSQKVTCICGCEVIVTSIPRHVESNKHTVRMLEANFEE